jgi:predicted acylesterase/phospholipase RssA
LASSGGGVRRRLRKHGKVALVCAGGGVTGAVYEVGCLRALEELLDRSVLDLDLYVGVSGGAYVASMLANGISPREMFDEIAARSRNPFGVPVAPLYRLGLREFLKRSVKAPKVLVDAVTTTLTGEGRNLSDLALSLFELLPPGLLDNSGIQEYLAKLFHERGGTDHFDRLSRELYLVAVDLDSGEAVTFGERDHRSLPISRAVQASTALPGLYRPVRIAGRDYVDGGVKKTAHINLAIRHGADLVVCINPIVPILNNGNRGPLNGHLSNKGVTYVLDQALRIMLHGRMQYGMERYETEHPEVDILLIQPTRDDMSIFSYNIMRMSARKVVAEDGYRSAIQSFRKNRAAWGKTLRRHGIGLRDPSRVPLVAPEHPYRSPLSRKLSGSLDVLGSRLRKRA